MANYVKTVTDGDGALWGLARNPLGAISRNHTRMPGTASDLRVVRGQIQARSVSLGAKEEWYTFNGSAWVQPVPSVAQPPTAPPTALQPPTAQPIIVDNRSPMVLRVGTWCQSSTAVGFFGQDSEKTCDDQPLKRFRWTPVLPTAGLYDVYVWWVNNDKRSPAAVYTVHNGMDANRTFDQRTGGNQWVLHGRYLFAAGSADNWVEVSNPNRGVVGADAVRFVPVDVLDHRTGR